MIKIAMYRAGRNGVQRWHWFNDGQINCGKPSGNLQCWRDLPAAEVAVATQLCSDCRSALLAKKLIAEPKKKES